MKETKKIRKKANGMNAATAHAFKQGFKPPVYANVAKPGEPVRFAKVKAGVPYVNPNNF